ncbi:MAG TPA: hypothetical protein VF103_15620 [Polyangiaceae bacterium]
MSGNRSAGGAKRPVDVDTEALLCALVLAPHAFSRNRFFELFEEPEKRRVRRRATRVRGILRQLLAGAEITGEIELDDGRRLLRYSVPSMGLSRTAALSPLEFAALRFALDRSKKREPDAQTRALVEGALHRLGGPPGVLGDLPTSPER